MKNKLGFLFRAQALAAMAVALLTWSAHVADAADAPPIKIGLGMALTGGLAGNGKAALLGFQLWAEDVNARGGILGRKVELIYYDDQSNPSTVPGIYSKLLDIDKVDLVFSGYATNQIAPAMPILMERGMVVMSLFALSLNDKFNYPYYFDIQPTGPGGKVELARGFFEAALARDPKPKTVAIVYADAEFAKTAAEGARAIVGQLGLSVVYDKSYPPNMTDFTSVVRAAQATNPDIVWVGSYPPDSAGLIRAANEVGLKTKMFGGAMVGLQFAALKTQLGPLLNGVVFFDYYVPEPTLNFPGIEDFVKKYQARAGAAGVDPLGFYLPPFAYAEGQILAQAAESVGSLDQKKMGEYIRASTFKTIVGDIKFHANGEWATPRVLQVQYQNIKDNSLEQFKKPGIHVIVYPDSVKSGQLLYPYSDVKR
jgi:branched-chain amino acid transport system substrate-binding protein